LPRPHEASADAHETNRASEGPLTLLICELPRPEGRGFPLHCSTLPAALGHGQGAELRRRRGWLPPCPPQRVEGRVAIAIGPPAAGRAFEDPVAPASNPPSRIRARRTPSRGPRGTSAWRCGTGRRSPAPPGVELPVVLVPLPQVQRQLPQLREGRAPPVPSVGIRVRPPQGIIDLAGQPQLGP
jgi:hypothetical protein